MSSSTSRITELASTISKNTAIVDQYFTDNGIPTPSFAADGPLLEHPLPPVINAARIEVIDATIELHELLQGPRRMIQNAACDIRVDCRLLYNQKLAFIVPLDNPEGITYAELSKRTGIAQDALTRIFRSLILHRIFVEPKVGHVAHSAASRLLATDAIMQDWLGFMLEDRRPAIDHLATALELFPAADEPTETGASLAFRQDFSQPLQGFYTCLAQQPDRSRRFAVTMSMYHKQDFFDPRHIVEGYPWADLPDGATVVDLGGSRGEVAMTITRAFPQLKFVVEDLPDTIAAASSPPDGLNVSFLAHDFFQPQPVKGAAVYMFRWILHNWPTKFCIRILQNLIPAFTNGARVLVIDTVTPPFGSLPNTIERDMRSSDLSMLANFNAKEREAWEWEDLFGRVDERLKFLGIKKKDGCRDSFIEAVWEG